MNHYIYFNFEKKIDDFSMPIIEYEVYSLINNKSLDLNYCKDKKIEISFPVQIDENNLFKYNISDDYYTDKCYPYTTNFGTDIILNDRKKEYINNNMSLCESNCKYNGYNISQKRAIYSCPVKQKFTFYSDINIDLNRFMNNFIDLKSTTNLYVLSCYKLLFSKDRLLYNKGNYVLLLIILIHIILLTYFIIKGYEKFCNRIKNIMDSLKENKNINNNNLLENRKKGKKDLKIISIKETSSGFKKIKKNKKSKKSKKSKKK